MNSRTACRKLDEEEGEECEGDEEDIVTATGSGRGAWRVIKAPRRGAERRRGAKRSGRKGKTKDSQLSDCLLEEFRNLKVSLRSFMSLNGAF